MGEGTPHVAESHGASPRVVALSAAATAARDRLETLLAELRRRRDEVLDWRMQLRRYRGPLTIVLGGIVAAAAASVAVQIARSRRQAWLAARVAELTDKAERLGRAIGRVVQDPDRLAPVAPPRKKWAAVPAALSLVVPVLRVLLPHIAAALAPRTRRR
jgi:hypothetical protein